VARVDRLDEALLALQCQSALVLNQTTIDSRKRKRVTLPRTIARHRRSVDLLGAELSSLLQQEPIDAEWCRLRDERALAKRLRAHDRY
jgi:hypothetical protein